MEKIDKQIRIYVKGGCVVNVETNFEGSYQLIDLDDDIESVDKYSFDILEPDAIYEGEDLFNKEIEV